MNNFQNNYDFAQYFINIMLTVIFGRVTLTKAAKYLMLLVANAETKRTNISQWTSNPSFAELDLDSSPESVTLKLCEATSDRKLKIVGMTTIKLPTAVQNDVIFQGEVKLQQQVQGQQVCVGICYVTIREKIQFQQLEFKQPVRNTMAIQSQQGVIQNDDDDQIDKQQTQEPNEEVRIQFHCGFGFYLGSQFRIQADWGKQFYKTQLIRDKINPIWSESACLSGLSTKKLQIRVCDHKNNILQTVRIDVGQLRVMFPYHLRIKFKDEFMGAVPEIFISIIRQTFPLFAITQIPVRFEFRSLAQAAKPLTYVIISLNKQLRFPNFIELNLNKLTSIQLINKHINSKTVGEQDRIDLVGMPTLQKSKTFSVLKSYLNRKLYLHLFSISDIKATFGDQNISSLKLIEFKSDLQTALRRIYYETFTLKKHLQIGNPQSEMQGVDSEAPAQERWKLLSNNYLLRNNLVLSSKRHIQNLRKAIEEKGAQLVELKKVVIAVKSINNTLTAKQRLMNSIKNKKIRYNAKQITNEELITALIAKQSELQEKKTINSELALRMNCLADVQENQEELTAQVIQNSKELLQQQEKLKRMRFMQKELGRQRQMIAQLQKMFQRGEIDKKVNQALREQSQRLREIKEKKQHNLLKVYNTVKQQGKQGGSLPARIKRAEEALITLNEQYARMVAL